MSVVTRQAGDRVAVREIVPVEHGLHREVPARGLLGRKLVAREIAGHVAGRAARSQKPGQRGHHAGQTAGGLSPQKLDVLEDLFGGLVLPAGQELLDPRESLLVLGSGVG